MSGKVGKRESPYFFKGVCCDCFGKRIMKRERDVKYLTEKVYFRNFNRSVEVNEYKAKKIQGLSDFF